MVEDVGVYSDRITKICSKALIRMYNNLHSKCAYTAIISWYFNAGDVGVVGGSGAAATV